MRYPVSGYFLPLYFPSQMVQSRKCTNGGEEDTFIAACVATSRSLHRKLWTKIEF